MGEAAAATQARSGPCSPDLAQRGGATPGVVAATPAPPWGSPSL